MIPPRAVESAARVIAREVLRTSRSADISPLETARLALDAAAPFIAAAAFQRGYISAMETENK